MLSSGATALHQLESVVDLGERHRVRHRRSYAGAATRAAEGFNM